MGLKARKLFPTIRFKQSIIAGDSYSDILFGHRLGMVTVLIGTDEEVLFKCAGILDYSFPDLISFAEFIKENLPANI
jgi:histidinol phosphatase-like enzyme